MLKIDEVVQAIREETLGVHNEVGRAIKSINSIKIGTFKPSMLENSAR